MWAMFKAYTFWPVAGPSTALPWSHFPLIPYLRHYLLPLSKSVAAVRLPWTQWLETTKTYSSEGWKSKMGLTGLLQSGLGQSRILFGEGSPWGEPTPCFFQLLLAACIPWLAELNLRSYESGHLRHCFPGFTVDKSKVPHNTGKTGLITP